MPAPSKTKIYGSLLLVQIIFGFHYLTTSIIVEEVDPFEWTAIRILFAGFIMYSLYSKKINNFPKGNEWYFLILLSLLGIVLNTAFFTKGLELTTPAHASLISCMIPVITFLFAWILGREGLNRYKSLSLVVAMSGALILMEIDKLDISSDLFVGDVFIFINFTCFGLFLVLSKSMIEKHSSLGLSVLVMSIGALLLIPVAVYGIYNNWESWLNLSWWIYFAAFYSIFFATVITYSLNYYAMEYVDSSKVALFIYLQPVVAGTISVALGRDEITTRLIVSSILIMLGLLLSTVEMKSSPKISQ
ncbi:MAG: DMT family transporter [Candidatus Poseidoniales archaeon]